MPWLEPLIERIYEAALVPAEWQAVLETLSTIGGGVGAALHAASPGTDRWIASPGLAPVIAAAIETGFIARNERLDRALQLNHPGFVTDRDLFSPEARTQSRLHREFLLPRGLGYCAGTLIRPPSGDLLVLTVERAEQDGPVPAEAVAMLDRLRPHLARAALVSSRLRLEQARAAVAALELMNLPAAMLGERGQVVAMNSLLATLVPQVAQDRQERLMLTAPGADRLLAQALEAISAGRDGGAHSIPVPVRPEQVPMVVHLVPVRGAAQDVFNSARSLLVITPVTHGGVASTDVIQGLFDLTPAEARVARSIAQGLTPEATAQALGVTVDTVRKQLAAVMAKTGLRRQASLVGLLAGTAAPMG